MDVPARALSKSERFKARLKALAAHCGIEVTRASREEIGVDPFRDMACLLDGFRSPVIIDAGANIGQSVQRFRQAFPSSSIHSFEPSPLAFAELEKNVEAYPRVSTINCALGSEPGEGVLLENIYSDMSSLLKPGPLSWGTVARSTKVRIQTLDDYALEHDLNLIHILKVDTQGFDLEVLKGARKLLLHGKISLVFTEITFSKMYQDAPACEDILSLMNNHKYELVAFYRFHFQNGRASWCDALFACSGGHLGGFPTNNT